MIKNLCHLHVKYRYYCHILMKLEFSQQFFLNTLSIKTD